MPWLARRLIGIGRWLRALGTLVRIRNSSTGAAYTLLGAYLAVDAGRVLASPVLRAALVVLLVIASGNVINDFHDADADAVAKPGRPIPSGRIARRTAGWLAIALALAALIVALTLDRRLAAFAAATIVLSVGYSYGLKNVPLVGNGTVALLCAAILVYGGLAAGPLTPAVLAATAMTFLFVFAQEVFYTVEDEEGDRQSAVSTTATRLGTTVTLRIFKILALLFIAASLAPWLADVAPDRYLYAIVPCTIAPTLGVVALLSVRLTKGTIGFSSWLTRVIWFSSVVAIILLK